MATLVEQALQETTSGNVERAHQLFREAVRRRENHDVAWAWLAHRAADAEEWHAALSACDRAISAGDPPWWTFHVRGVALIRLGRAAEAVLPLQRAAMAAPDSLDVAIAQARCGLAIRDSELTARALETAQRLDPRDPRAVRVTALQALADGRSQAAEMALRQLVREDDIDVEALNNLGAALAAQGLEREGRPFFRQAMIHGEVTPVHRVTRGNFLRVDRRFPDTPVKKKRWVRPKMATAQYTVLRWLLIAGLFIEIFFVNHLLGAAAVVIASAARQAWRRRRPGGRYHLLPAYIDMTVVVPREAPERPATG